jgi:hypothetical protein
MGFEAHILCTVFYFKVTKDICLEVRRPDRMAYFLPHLISIQGMHLDPSRWTSNYAVIILINSMEHFPSWKTKSCWTSQRSYLHNRKIRYRVESIAPFVLILSQINIVHAISNYYFNIRLNIIFSTTPKSSKLSVYLRIPHQKSSRISLPTFPSCLTLFI